MNKKYTLFFGIVIVFSCLFTVKSITGYAEQTIPNGQYIITSLKDTAAEYRRRSDTYPLNSDVFARVARSEEAFTYQFEYRAEKAGYVIFNIGYRNDLLTQYYRYGEYSNLLIGEQLEEPLNEHTVIPDRSIWDISAPDQDGNCVIKNRATWDVIQAPTVIVSNTAWSVATFDSKKENQKMKLKAFKGVFEIANATTKKPLLFDIENGITEGNKIVLNKKSGIEPDTQKWFLIFKNVNNGFILANATDRSLILSQDDKLEDGSFPNPVVRKNNTAFSEPLVGGEIIYFSGISNSLETLNVFSKVLGERGSVYGEGMILGGNPEEKRNLDLNRSMGIENERFLLNKVGEIPEPILSNITVSGTLGHGDDFFYVGEKLKVSGKVTADPVYHGFDLFSRFHLDPEKLDKENIPLVNGQGAFDTWIDTSSYTDGEKYIELFVRADKLFESNRISGKYKLVYPTPKATPVKQYIKKGTDNATLKASDFVRDISDEIESNDMTVSFDESISSLDTNLVGDTTVKVLVKNKYKTTTIEVPVSIVTGDPIAVTIEFQKKETKTVLHKEESIVSFAGTKLNLLDNAEIAKIIKDIENKNVVTQIGDYSLSNEAELKEVTVSNVSPQSIVVKFDGSLTIDSIARIFKFFDGDTGKRTTQKVPLKTTSDTTLRIHDSRGYGHGNFVIKSKLENDLATVDGKYTIKGASIEFADNNSVNAKDYAIIATSTALKDDTNIKYNYTVGKVGSDNRIRLVIPRGSVKQEGTYTGALLWELENGP